MTHALSDDLFGDDPDPAPTPTKSLPAVVEPPASNGLMELVEIGKVVGVDAGTIGLWFQEEKCDADATQRRIFAAAEFASDHSYVRQVLREGVVNVDQASRIVAWKKTIESEIDFYDEQHKRATGCLKKVLEFIKILLTPKLEDWARRNLQIGKQFCDVPAGRLQFRVTKSYWSCKDRKAFEDFLSGCGPNLRTELGVVPKTIYPFDSDKIAKWHVAQSSKPGFVILPGWEEVQGRSSMSIQ